MTQNDGFFTYLLGKVFRGHASFLTFKNTEDTACKVIKIVLTSGHFAYSLRINRTRETYNGILAYNLIDLR